MRTTTRWRRIADEMQARFFPAAWQGNAGARRRHPRALRHARDQGAAGGRSRTIWRAPPLMNRWPTCCCSTPRPPHGATRPGGHGAAFDWQMLKGRNFNQPWFLAGGLNPENVAPRHRASAARRWWMCPRASKARRASRATALIADFVAAARQQVAGMSLAPNSYRTGPDASGHFGAYGGRFVAETLMPLVLSLEAAYEAAKKDPAFQAELDGLLEALCRARKPALFRRAADGAFRRRENLSQARRPQPYRRAQDQQLPGPDPAGAAHGQDPHHRRDRRRPAWRRHRHGLRPLRPALHHLYGRSGYRAAEAQCLPHEAAGRGSAPRLLRLAHPERRHERSDPRLGRQCRRHLLHHRFGGGACIPIPRWCAISRP